MDIISEWGREFLDAPLIQFPRVIVAEGERIAHLGPRYDFARVRARFEPAPLLMVTPFEMPIHKDSPAFAKATLFGILDVLATYEKQPILGTRITILGLEIDEVNSNERAFRLAGRSAAAKALEDAGFWMWQRASQ